MSLVLFNTLTRKKEEFVPINPPNVKMYCCGPTVYDLLHVGNFRGAVFYNLLRLWLAESGYKVESVYNYTDVDDKIINRAQKDGVDSKEISEKYIKEFQADFQRLKLSPFTHFPRVSEHMNDIEDMVQELIEKKKAYVVDGEVLYSIKAFDGYGKLSNRNPDDLKSGVRIEVGDRKHDPLDFALWKPAKPGEPSWPSPWGAGRPGWHIECSAMIRGILGDQIDIHGGGMDLLFPHHENEIAQSEGCTGKPFVRCWVHNNMINFGGSKMSKSLGNVTTGRAFFDKYHPETFKFLILSSHYRSILDLGPQAIENAMRGSARIYSALAMADLILSSSIDGTDPVFEKAANEAWVEITKALNDDLGTPEVFAKIFDLTRLFNSQVRRGGKVTPAIVGKAKAYRGLVMKFGKISSLFQEPASAFLKEIDLLLMKDMNLDPAQVESMVEARVAARAAKDFAKSDELRDALVKMGIVLADTADGTHWEVAK